MRLEKAINPLLDDNDQVALSFILENIVGQLKGVENVSDGLLNVNQYTAKRPALEAQSDAHLTGDQEVAGSITARSNDSLSWRLIMKYFLWLSLHSADSRGLIVIFWQ